MDTLRRLNHQFDYEANPGWLVLGLGRTFRIPAEHDRNERIWWRFADRPEWFYSSIPNQSQSQIIFTCRFGWLICNENPENINLYNPGQPGIPIPTRLTARTIPDHTPDFEDEDEDDVITDEEIIAEAHPGDTGPDGTTILTVEMINNARIAVGLPTIAPNPVENTDTVASTQFTPPAGSAKLWCLTFNGAPVSTLEEFVLVARPLLDVATGVIPNILWAAQWQADAESVADRYMDAEPVLVACIGYTPVAQPTGAVVAEVITPMELAEQPVGALIVRAAAGALLSGGMSNHFSFNEQGGLVINAENPPSLDQGYQMMGRVFSTEETGERLKNFSRWTQGALIAELQRFFGDAFQMDQLCEATDRTYNTLNACLNTHLRWAHRKREALSWTHHKEVEFSTIEEPDKEWVLDQSVRYGLTVAEQRKLQSFVRTYGRPEEDTMPEDRTALLERLDTRSTNRNFMFMLQGAWYQYRGPFEHIPNGAAQVINADTRQVLDREGRATAPQTWVPVGIEVPAPRGHAAINEAGIEEARETGGRPRRSRGGRTQTAAVPTGPPLTPEDVEEAMAGIEEAVAEHREAQIERAINTLDLANTEAAPQVADLGFRDLQPMDITIQELREGQRALQGQTIHHTVEGSPDVLVIDPTVALTQRQNATAIPYDDRFFNEPGARRLVEMNGYPMGMPNGIRALLDAARTEDRAPEILGPLHETGSAFRAFLEASDDHLIPF